MNLLVKNVKIVNPDKAVSTQTSVHIVDGVISEIGKALTADSKATIFDAKGAILSPGFFDLNCTAGDPGYENREDLASVTETASAGGFTGIALMPNAKPVVQTKAGVEYILNNTRDNLVSVYPVGAISQQLEGKELAELYDMKQAGAVAFADGNRAIADDGFMSRALQYALGFDGLLMSFPENKAIAGKAQVNESSNSILLGMKGNPALAEEMQIARDIFLAAYHNSPVHISNISTVGGVALIKKAKKDGVKVTCDVTAHHLVLTEQALASFDSNYKVKPPLRGKADVKALLAGLKDGTIDAITSQHTPQEIEFKAVEFDAAAYGIIGLQTVLPLLVKAGLTPELITEKLAVAPRRILALPIIEIKEGVAANFVVYDPQMQWVYNNKTNCSKSDNSPFLNTELQGKVLLTCNNKKFISYE